MTSWGFIASGRVQKEDADTEMPYLYMDTFAEVPWERETFLDEFLEDLSR